MTITKLHMGFVATPYTKEARSAPVTYAKAEASRKRRRSFSKTMTADRVAKILEGKYGIVETFSTLYEPEIAKIIKDGFKEISANLIGKEKEITSSSVNIAMKPHTKEIELMFRNFLTREELNGMVDGVPTEAALQGHRSWRGKRTHGSPRQSFIRTGIYRASFRCWSDTKVGV